MERFQDQLAQWLDGKSVRGQRQIVAAGLILMCVTAGMGSLLGRNPISITVGSLSGLAMALLLRRGFTLLPSGAQDQWNLKARYPFTTRRWIVGFLAAIVISVLIGAGSHLPYAFGGAVTVCVFILLALLFLPTAEEALDMELQAAEAAEAEERAASAPEWDGLDPESDDRFVEPGEAE